MTESAAKQCWTFLRDSGLWGRGGVWGGEGGIHVGPGLGRGPPSDGSWIALSAPVFDYPSRLCVAVGLFGPMGDPQECLFYLSKCMVFHKGALELAFFSVFRVLRDLEKQAKTWILSFKSWQGGRPRQETATKTQIFHENHVFQKPLNYLSKTMLFQQKNMCFQYVSVNS